MNLVHCGLMADLGLIIHHLKFLRRKKEKVSQTLPFGTAIRRGI